MTPVRTHHHWIPLAFSPFSADLKCTWDGHAEPAKLLPSLFNLVQNMGPENCRLRNIVGAPSKTNWLVVSTPLKNIGQWEGLSHILWKIQNVPNQQPANIIYCLFTANWRRNPSLQHRLVGANDAQDARLTRARHMSHSTVLGAIDICQWTGFQFRDHIYIYAHYILYYIYTHYIYIYIHIIYIHIYTHYIHMYIWLYMALLTSINYESCSNSWSLQPLLSNGRPCLVAVYLGWSIKVASFREIRTCCS